MALNFSYKKFFGGDTLMVIVPHEDDEINIAGAAICGAHEEGMHVLCVFVTNGDWKYIGDVRMHEAIQALSVLGVPEEDVIFLGYPDGGVSGERSVYRRTEENANEVGQTGLTYGIPKKPEFCMAETGIHHTCTWENLLRDMQSVIEKHLPDAILAIDFDRHSDHRMCSIAFETAMGRILNRKGNSYHPSVLKALAYTTAYESVDDFDAPNLLSTVINDKKRLYSEFLDNPCYEWESRIRLPVPESCQVLNIARNKIFRSLLCHMSQHAMQKAKCIINGDEVFWRRRTDNLIYSGHVTVSSGNGNALHDFRIAGVKDISTARLKYDEDIWIPDESDTDRWCRCDFDKPQTVEEIVFYGNVEPQSCIRQGRLIFSTGFEMEVGPFPNMGRPLRVTFPSQSDVHWIKFYLTDAVRGHAGLAEWEIFAAKQEEKILKICVDGNFAYKWLLAPKQEPELTVYSPSGWNVSYTLDGKPISKGALRKTIQNLTSVALLRAEADDHPEYWDEITLIPVTSKDKWAYLIRKSENKCTIWWKKQMERYPHHRLRKFKRK